MKLRSIITAALLAVAQPALTAPAQNPLLIQPNIESMVRVPAGGFNLVKDGSTGRLLLISDNARYVVTDFVMRDMWHNNVKIDSTELLTKLADKVQRTMIPYDRMMVLTVNPPDAKAKPVKTKAGPLAPKPVLTAFVDPNCGYCRELFRMATETKEIEVRFMVIPILGDDSEAKARQLSCAVQKGDSAKALNALLTHNYGGLPAQDQCKTHDGLRANLITANVMGIRGVPFLVADDGTITKGLVPELVAFTTSKPTPSDEPTPQIVFPTIPTPFDSSATPPAAPTAMPVTITPNVTPTKGAKP